MVGINPRQKSWYRLLVGAALVVLLTSAAAAERVNIKLATRAHQTTASGPKIQFISEQDLYSNLLIPMFEEEHPDIDVEWTPLSGGWQDKVALGIVSGTAPDVFEMWGPFDREWGINGLLLDLTPYVNRDYSAAEIDDFIPAQWEAGMIRVGPHKGERLGLPRYVDASLVYYNRDLLEEFGLVEIADLDRRGEWTWDTLRQYAKKLTVFESGLEKPQQLGMSEGVGWWMTWIWSGGGDLFDYPENPTTFTLHQPESLRGLEFLLAMIWEDRSVGFWTRDDFFKGGTGMRQDDLHPLGQYTNSIGDTFEWDVVPPPTGPSGERGAWVDADQWGISATTKQPDAAWEFIKFLASPEVNALTASKVGNAPARFSAYPTYLQLLPEKNIRSVVDTFQTAHGYPWSTTVLYGNRVQPIVSDALTKSLRRGEAPVSQAMAEIAPVVDAVYRELGVGASQ